MLKKLPVSTVRTLFLEVPGGRASTRPDAPRAASSTVAAPEARHRFRTAATSTFPPTRGTEQVALAAIWLGVAVLLVVGVASLFAFAAG